MNDRSSEEVVGTGLSTSIALSALFSAPAMSVSLSVLLYMESRSL